LVCIYRRQGIGRWRAAQCADNAIRTLTHLLGEGYEIIEKNIPLEVFGLRPKKYRELDNKDRQELATAKLALVDVFGSEENFLAHCRHKEYSLFPAG